MRNETSFNGWSDQEFAIAYAILDSAKAPRQIEDVFAIQNEFVITMGQKPTLSFAVARDPEIRLDFDKASIAINVICRFFMGSKNLYPIKGELENIGKTGTSGGCDEV